MHKEAYGGSSHYRPLSTLSYMGYALLFSIPLLGLIPLVLFSLDGSHINRRNFARAWLCFVLIGLLLLGILSMLVAQTLSVHGARLSAFLRTVGTELQQFVQKLQAFIRDGAALKPNPTSVPQLP